MVVRSRYGKAGFFNPNRSSDLKRSNDVLIISLFRSNDRLGFNFDIGVMALLVLQHAFFDGNVSLCILGIVLQKQTYPPHLKCGFYVL